jgi:hypothetical protein
LTAVFCLSFSPAFYQQRGRKAKASRKVSSFRSLVLPIATPHRVSDLSMLSRPRMKQALIFAFILLTFYALLGPASPSQPPSPPIGSNDRFPASPTGFDSTSHRASSESTTPNAPPSGMPTTRSTVTWNGPSAYTRTRHGEWRRCNGASLTSAPDKSVHPGRLEYLHAANLPIELAYAVIAKCPVGFTAASLISYAAHVSETSSYRQFAPPANKHRGGNRQCRGRGSTQNRADSTHHQERAKGHASPRPCNFCCPCSTRVTRSPTLEDGVFRL